MKYGMQGDFGNTDVIEAFTKIKPLKGVYGNIDGTEIRKGVSGGFTFQCEEVEVLMIHIGGYPGRYSPLAKAEINKQTPKIFISGHSHILKVMMDKERNILHLNPGPVVKLAGIKSVGDDFVLQLMGSEIKGFGSYRIGGKINNNEGRR